MEMNIAVILPAAGQSKRFGSGDGKTSKLSVMLARKPVLQRAVELFSSRPLVKQIIIAADPDQLEAFKFRWEEKLGVYGVRIVAGGRQERWETVLNAIKALEPQITHVAVHDAARPVTDPAMIDRVFEAARQHHAVIPAVPITATIKRVQEPAQASAEALDLLLSPKPAGPVPRQVLETIPRAGLWAVQTPQVFERKLLERAYQRIAQGQMDPSQITDDAGLVESLGEPVIVVEGDGLNVKITVPQDVQLAEAVLAVRSSTGGDTLGPKRKHPTWAQMDEE